MGLVPVVVPLAAALGAVVGFLGGTVGKRFSGAPGDNAVQQAAERPGLGQTLRSTSMPAHDNELEVVPYDARWPAAFDAEATGAAMNQKLTGIRPTEEA